MPVKYLWLRVPLEDILLFCLGLSVLITLLEMLKELRKKYAHRHVCRHAYRLPHSMSKLSLSVFDQVGSMSVGHVRL